MQAVRWPDVQRPDDAPEVIVERLRTYEAETAPLLDYYEQQQLLHVISAEGEPEAVEHKIMQVLEQAQTQTA